MADATSPEVAGKYFFLTPNLPCADPEKWGRVKYSFGPEALAKLFQSKAKLTTMERLVYFARAMSAANQLKLPQFLGLKVTATIGIVGIFTFFFFSYLFFVSFFGRFAWFPLFAIIL